MPGKKTEVRWVFSFQENAVNGEHLWLETNVSGDLCYLGEENCQVRFAVSVFLTQSLWALRSLAGESSQLSLKAAGIIGLDFPRRGLKELVPWEMVDRENIKFTWLSQGQLEWFGGLTMQARTTLIECGTL